MKRIIHAFFIFCLFFTFSLNSGAQEKPEGHKHKHGWPMGDTASMKDFQLAMDGFNMSDFPFSKKNKKYNGHWAGVEIGIGGYVNSGFNMNFSPAYPYMNMNTARSVTVNFNPFELNVNIYKNHIGFTTGLGFQTSNYYFTDNYVMLKDSSSLVAYKVQDSQGNLVSLKTNKMVVSYLNLPLFFEYQSNRYRRLTSFHITVGVIVGVRIGSYTKQVYSEKSGTYFLVDEKGNKVATYEVDRYIARNSGAYHLSPFKIDAAFRVGWSHLNLFGTYSLTRMFQKNQGPELYPFTVGITLLGW
ncbi:MAG: outer membrane beta-barrel protein [Bacteroidetes bacterium]|nr:outer membrane beta-barrel protein [Bacteroidota bacterium]